MDINLRKSGHCYIKISSFFPLMYLYFKSRFLITINLPYLDTILNFPSRKKSTSYFRSHSRTTNPTSSKLWNRRLPKGCFSGPNKRQSDVTKSGLQCGCSRTFQQNYCNSPCVCSALLHCYAKASHHVSDISGFFLRLGPRYHRSMSLFALTVVFRDIT